MTKMSLTLDLDPRGSLKSMQGMLDKAKEFGAPDDADLRIHIVAGDRPGDLGRASVTVSWEVE